MAYLKELVAMRTKAAFTLVELLVVIAIIGVLVGLILPAVQAARATSRNMACKSNMRQIGVGIHQFANTNNGRFPFNVHRSVEQSWLYTLSPYIEGVDEIRICPDDPKSTERLTGTYKGTSYLISEYVSTEVVEGAVLNLFKLKETSKLIILFEGADANGELDDHAHVTSWYSPVYVKKKWVWTSLQAEVNPRRHGVSSNYLYADGHVEAISIDDMREIVEEDMVKKTIFFRPYR